MILGILSLLICIGIPVGGAVFFLRKRNGTFVSFAAGVLAFTVSQLVLRIPLLNYLSTHAEWMMVLPAVNVVLYGAFLAFTAGIFEETARWIGLGFGKKKGRTAWIHAIAFGLGHGGVEAVWIALQGLVPALLNGTLFLFGEDAVLVAGERLGAMLFHIGATLVVMTGIRTGKRRWLGIAVLLHFLLDFTVVFQNGAVIAGILAVSAVVSAAGILITYKKWKEEGGAK